jgi:toxin ParE1/3/4
MRRIEWSDEAIVHLAQIHSFIAADSPKHADKFIIKLMDAVDRLATFPEIGRRMPDIRDASVREFTVAPYRVIYQLRKDTVSVAAVVHSSRDLDALNEKPWEKL